MTEQIKKRNSENSLDIGKIKKLDLKKDIKKGQVIVLIIPNEQYTKKTAEIAKYLSLEYNAVCYVSLNKLFSSLSENLKASKVNLNKFLFVDGITKSASPNVEKQDNVIYVESAAALTELSLTITKVFDTGKFEILFFDSLSSLLVYNKSEIVGKFVHSTINKLKAKGITAVFTALEGDTNSNLLKECSMYCDNIVHLK